MPINTPQDLKDHIELAIQVELSTIPPYLFAMYSIEDQESESSLLIRSIVVEEMLHAVLASNLLLAVGGSPSFGGTHYIPAYPSELPHHRPPLVLDLAPCSPELIENLFMRIEQPETHGAPAQPDEFETLGQFYHALEQGLEKMAGSFDLFADPQIERQMSNPHFYAPVTFDADDSGGLVGITDLESAIAAIEIIVHQGEGMSDDRWADPDHQELTHYYKLLQIHDGTSPLGAVRPLRANPRSGDYPEDLRAVSDLFNAVYRSLYLTMDRLFDGKSDQSRGVGVLYLLMADVLSRIGRFLVAQPLGAGEFAGPTFEVFEFIDGDPIGQLVQMSGDVAANHPELASVHDALRGLDLIL